MKTAEVTWPFKDGDILTYRGPTVVKQLRSGWCFVMRHKTIEFEVIKGELAGRECKCPLEDCLSQLQYYRGQS